MIRGMWLTEIGVFGEGVGGGRPDFGDEFLLFCYLSRTDQYSYSAPFHVSQCGLYFLFDTKGLV